MRRLKDLTDEECGHTDQAWERSEAPVVMIGVGLNWHGLKCLVPVSLIVARLRVL